MPSHKYTGRIDEWLVETPVFITLSLARGKAPTRFKARRFTRRETRKNVDCARRNSRVTVVIATKVDEVDCFYRHAFIEKATSPCARTLLEIHGDALNFFNTLLRAMQTRLLATGRQRAPPRFHLFLPSCFERASTSPLIFPIS